MEAGVTPTDMHLIGIVNGIVIITDTVQQSKYDHIDYLGVAQLAAATPTASDTSNVRPSTKRKRAHDDAHASANISNKTARTTGAAAPLNEPMDTSKSSLKADSVVGPETHLHSKLQAARDTASHCTLLFPDHRRWP
jgi:hypothetical protein